MSVHKALLLEKKFGDLVLGDIETPKPGPGEILVKVHAAALNPVDWKIKKYGFFVEKFPAVLGTDIAGEVSKLGEGVIDFAVGDRVIFQGQYLDRRKTGFQQYSVSAADIVAKIPSSLSYDEAASIPLAVSTAYIALYQPLPKGLGFDPPITASARQKYKSTPLVVLGGATSVGQVALQLAKHSGFFPIITTASLKNSEELKLIGATHVFDRNLSSSALAEEIAQITTDGEPLKYIFDSVSIKSTQETAVELLPTGGYIALVQTRQVEPKEGTNIVQVFGGYSPDTASLLEALYHDNLHDLLQDGVLKPNQVDVLPNGLAGIPTGLKRLEAGEASRSKFIAHPQDTV